MHALLVRRNEKNILSLIEKNLYIFFSIVYISKRIPDCHWKPEKLNTLPTF